ncbi:hypothetical protein OIE68_10905 [Nocardia vinacea]|uniref:hypothetical protein n=1 Tax=Nocardia vinacea TaxID=96468 RepID=UPI002E162BE8|nr:hypothetical protein OIE68_10905 [Nocardia vinacea]
MQLLTLAEIDAELATRTIEFDAITATLLELDKHPGHTLLQRFPSTGVTEQRWLPVRGALALMWEDYSRLQIILDSARKVRGTRARLDDGERAELTRLLRGRPYEAARTPIPMAQRSLTGPAEEVLFVGLADTVDRMRATFPEIAEFFDAIDAVNTRVMSGLAPLQDTLDKVGAAGGEITQLRAIGDGIAELLSRSATDPLALTVPEIDARIAELSGELRQVATIIAELDAVAADWAEAVAETRRRLAVLRATRARAAEARARVEAKILAGPLPVYEDNTAALEAELDTLSAKSGTAAELVRLRTRIADATAGAATVQELAQGLLDRRSELRGRLAAYQAKAARLGVSEDRDVLASNQIAAGLLARRPCDLAAVTRAVADFQQIIGEKSGRGR